MDDNLHSVTVNPVLLKHKILCHIDNHLSYSMYYYLNNLLKQVN